MALRTPLSTDGFAVTLVSPAGESLRFGPDDLENPPYLEYEPMTISGWDFTIPWNPDIESIGKAEAYIYYDGALLLRGELHSVRSDDSDSTTTLSGHGVMEELKTGDADRTFRNMPYAWAIEQYVDEEVDDFDIDVTEPPYEESVVNLTAQRADSTDELAAIFDLDDRTPLHVADGGLKLRQNCWHIECEHYARGNIDQLWGEDYFSGDQAVRFDSDADVSGGPHWAEWTWELDYTIPSIFFGLKVRDTQEKDDGLVGFEWYLINPEGREYDLDRNDEYGRDVSFGWSELALKDEIRYRGRSYDGPDLEPGEYTIGMRVTDSAGTGTGSAYYIDILCPFDSRYLPESRGYWNDNYRSLDDGTPGITGPPKSGVVPATGNQFSQEFNVTYGRLSLEARPTAGVEQIQLSNDGGRTWSPDSGARKRDNWAEYFEDTFGTTVQARVRLTAHSPDGERAETPKRGYALPEIRAWELDYSFNDRRVLNTEELRGSDFENLVQLHDGAGMVFVPEHSVDEKVLRSFVPGEIERPLPDVKIARWDRDRDMTQYRNSLTVYGGKSDVDGKPLSVSVRANDEIRERGEYPAEPVFRTNVTDEIQLETLANRLLAEMVNADELSASASIVPVVIQPGYAYRDARWDDEPLTLWRVTFDPGGSSGGLEFGPPDDLAEVIRTLASDISRVASIR